MAVTTEGTDIVNGGVVLEEDPLISVFGSNTGGTWSLGGVNLAVTLTGTSNRVSADFFPPSGNV